AAQKTCHMKKCLRHFIELLTYSQVIGPSPQSCATPTDTPRSRPKNSAHIPKDPSPLRHLLRCQENYPGQPTFTPHTTPPTASERVRHVCRHRIPPEPGRRATRRRLGLRILRSRPRRRNPRRRRLSPPPPVPRTPGSLPPHRQHLPPRRHRPPRPRADR